MYRSLNKTIPPSNYSDTCVVNVVLNSNAFEESMFPMDCLLISYTSIRITHAMHNKHSQRNHHHDHRVMMKINEVLQSLNSVFITAPIAYFRSKAGSEYTVFLATKHAHA